MIAKLAWRSVWRNKRRTIITVVSIGFGLAAALFFITFADGQYQKMINDSVRMQAGHITLEHPEYRDAPAVDLFVNDSTDIRREIEKLPDVEKVKLLVTGQGVARSGSGAVGVGFLGVEPSLEIQTSPLAKKIIKGEFLDDEDKRHVVIGSVLAKRLKLDIGKKMVLSTNDVNGNLVEELCRIKGIFSTGSDETDGFFILVPIAFARGLMQLPEDASTQIGVILEKQEKMKQVQKQIWNMLGSRDIVVLTWQQVMPDLNAFIKVDGGSNLVFQGIILTLVLFTIFNTILMSVLERKREFAVLLALGTSPNLLQAQVMMESVFLGLIGVFIGTVVGGAITWYYSIHGLDFSEMMTENMTVSGMAFDPIIYTHLTPGVFIILGSIVFIATVLLSVFPMRRAANTPISDVLR
ncbi:ABC transporter permease [bacterium]|nr:ABC transporter permease [bacterium]